MTERIGTTAPSRLTMSSGAVRVDLMDAGPGAPHHQNDPDAMQQFTVSRRGAGGEWVALGGVVPTGIRADAPLAIRAECLRRIFVAVEDRARRGAPLERVYEELSWLDSDQLIAALIAPRREHPGARLQNDRTPETASAKG